jgi:hypothetical protein
MAAVAHSWVGYHCLFGLSDHCKPTFGLTSTFAGQRQWERPSAPAFLPSPSFAGARPGYVFKAGHLGVGYYLDTGLKVVSEGIQGVMVKLHNWLLQQPVNGGL